MNPIEIGLSFIEGLALNCLALHPSRVATGARRIGRGWPQAAFRHYRRVRAGLYCIRHVVAQAGECAWH